MNAETPIRDTIIGIHTGEEHMAFLTAATINLYSEALRRIHNRALFAPADARAVAGIVATLYERTTEQREDVVIRARELTAEEQDAVLKGVTKEFETPKVASVRRV